jgi:hypothetical protein
MMRSKLRFLRSWFLWTIIGLLLASLVLLADNYVDALPLVGPRVNQLLNSILGGPLREKFGDAFLIAAVLAAIVDRYLKLHLLKEVQRDALSFAAGHMLPDSIKYRIADLIKVPYARKNFEMRLELVSISAGEVKLILYTSYDVVNFTNQRQDYEVQSSIEKGYGPLLRDAQLEDVAVSGSATFHRSGTQLLPGHRDVNDRDDDYLRFTRRVKLGPINTPLLRVETRRSIIYPESWFYVLDILELTLGIKIATERATEFNWRVHFGERPQSGTRTAPGLWTHSGVHLPGQFVRIAWTKI